MFNRLLLRWRYGPRIPYWLRPYDQNLDRRRWRWQRRGACGREFLAGLTQHERATLNSAIERAVARRSDEIAEQRRRRGAVDSVAEQLERGQWPLA